MARCQSCVEKRLTQLLRVEREKNRKLEAMVKKMQSEAEYSDFTPGIPVETDDLGRRVQVVDGEVRVLSPLVASRVSEWREAGFSDEAIDAWFFST